MKSVIWCWIPFLALLSSFVVLASSLPPPPPSSYENIDNGRSPSKALEEGFTPAETSPEISKRGQKPFRVGGIPPYSCDGIYHHLCCLGYTGHEKSHDITAHRCLRFSEIAWTNQNNPAGMQLGECNHEHFCCERIALYRRVDMLRRPKSIKRAERCKLIWKPEPYDDKRDRREPSE